MTASAGWALSTLGLLLLLHAPLVAQNTSSTIGLLARVAWAPSLEASNATGVGFEIELFPSRVLVPVARADWWQFGIDCPNAGSCPSGVRTLTAGLRYRLVSESPLTPYVGGDLGHMSWTSQATGWSLRGRMGGDVRLFRFTELNVDMGVMRLLRFPHNDGSMLVNTLVSVSGGFRLRF